MIFQLATCEPSPERLHISIDMRQYELHKWSYSSMRIEEIMNRTSMVIIQLGHYNNNSFVKQECHY